MRYITEKDFAIFDENRRLCNEHIRLEKEWLEEVKKHYKGEISYEETWPKFERSLKAFHKWQEYHNKNAGILLAQAQE